MKNLVFVYGTLQKAFSNHHLLADGGAELLGGATTMNRYIMRAQQFVGGSMGIPFVGKSQAISHIQGEVYEVNEAVLSRLDRLESCCIEDASRSWYHRELVDVRITLASGACETLRAWVYFNEGNGEAIVASGRWNDGSEPLEGKPVWYFAYGSNQDVQRMLDRQVRFDERCVGALPGFTRVFNKRSFNQPIAYANVMPNADATSSLRGVLYRTSESSLEALDRFEGAPNHYRRETMRVQLEATGEWVDAVVYVAQADKLAFDLPVKRSYRDHVTAGNDLLGNPANWTNTEWPEVLVA